MNQFRALKNEKYESERDVLGGIYFSKIFVLGTPVLTSLQELDDQAKNLLEPQGPRLCFDARLLREL